MPTRKSHATRFSFAQSPSPQSLQHSSARAPAQNVSRRGCFTSVNIGLAGIFCEAWSTQRFLGDFHFVSFEILESERLISAGRLAATVPPQCRATREGRAPRLLSS